MRRHLGIKRQASLKPLSRTQLSSSGLIPWENYLDYHGRMRTRRRRYRIDPVEATAIFLRRLATVSRWVDVQDEFGKHSACLTEIFYHTIELFYSKFCEHMLCLVAVPELRVTAGKIPE
jgi:hypothetical protein